MQTLNFIFNNTELNIYGSFNEPLFVVNDICELIQIDNRSHFMREIKNNPKFRGVKFDTPQIPQYQGQKKAVVNERGLYEIMFKSSSKLCDQFKDEICDWLKQQRLSQNLIKNEQIKNLEQLNQNLQNELQQEKVQQRIDFLKNNFNHRVTYFFHPETEQLLYAISYDEKYRRQNTKKILNLLQDEGFDEEEIEVIHCQNHYQKYESKQIVDSLDKYYKLQGDNVLVLA